MDNNEKRASLYGKNAPLVTFEKVIQYTDALVRIGGASGTADDLSKAVNTGNTTSGAYMSRRAALKNHGIIRMDSKGYQLEELGAQITSGLPDVRREAIKKSFLAIPTVRKIWETYKGGLLPSRESFGNNLLVRIAEDIPTEVKDDWAKYFLDGAEFAGFLDRRPNGFYLNQAEPNPDSVVSGRTEPSGKTEIAKREPTALQTIFTAPSDVVNYSKVLVTERMLTITLPENPTPDEAREVIARLSFVIKSMKGFLDGDVEEG